MIQKNIIEGLQYVIIRGEKSGVFAGYLKERTKNEVILLKARRIWYWSGANSLSQLAMDGVSRPKECKFPIELEMIEILDAIEVIYCTEKGRISIKNVPIWDKH